MNAQQMKDMIAARKFADLESAWLQAGNENLPPDQMASVLEAVIAAGKTDVAETLAWALLAERTQRPPQENLPLARALLLAVPTSAELRRQTAELYQAVHADHPDIKALMEASGLTGTQSPRRALRTLETCLAIRQGAYLANRFDARVFRAVKFNDIMGEYELTGPAGAAIRMDPKNLADEFDLVDENDFRVLCQHRPAELGQLLKADSAAVLIGLCTMHGGQIDSTAVKDMLCPQYIPADQWADWWSKARTAARRCVNLNMTGRNPVTISYHAGGLSLEQELAAAVKAAKTPLEKLAILQQYAREVRDRKLTIDAAFAGPLMAALAEQAASFRDKRPADALAASLSLETAAGMGFVKPDATYPSAEEIIASASHAAAVVAELADSPLWNSALKTLATRSDVAEQLRKLLEFTPASLLDDVAGRLMELNCADGVAQATATACADPLKHLELFIWLWKGPAQPPANTPSKVELLSRLLKALLELEHDWNVPPSVRKHANQRLRAALSASEYASFRQSLTQMDEAVAGTIKRLIERAGGLSQSVRESMMGLLRESFFGLFVKAKIEPWLDENILWTTESTLHRREDELKELVEVKMLENARAIGAAAEHGDLSENSEWKFALEERDMLRARAAKMQDELAIARPIHAENVPADSIGVGSKVTLRRLSDNEAIVLSFLGPWDSDLAKNVYSYQTPLAQDLMGLEAGQTVTLKIKDQQDNYRIERIESAV